MNEMTSYERVQTALNHQEPDRVPTALGGGPYGIVDDLYHKLLAYLEIGEPIAPFRSGHTISYMDDRLFERLGIDTRYVWPGDSPSNLTKRRDDPDILIDGYGQPWKRATPYYFPLKGILRNATIKQIDTIIKWPDSSDSHWSAGVQERAKFLKEDTDFYVIARMVTSHGPYTTACNLRGTEEYMIDMSIDPAFAHALINRVTDVLCGLLETYLNACGNYIDMIELPGDDYASNINLLISPKMFREFIKPSLARLIAIVKSYRDDIKIMMHSDGLIEKLLPDFIDLGIDVVHPIEPVPALNPLRIKQKYGTALSFLGTIDITHAMPGNKEDVTKEAITRINQFAPGGGFILAPSNHLQADVPPENVVALFDAVRKYGYYPIGK
jgi:uroporphyrinogen decarboxylase